MSERQTHGGKGDSTRPLFVSQKIKNLRWELAFDSTPERKIEIKEELNKLYSEDKKFR